MAYTAQDFEAKTNQLKEAMLADKRQIMGGYCATQSYLTEDEIAVMVSFIEANPQSPLIENYTVIGWLLFYKPQ